MSQTISVIDSHTGGEPTRVIIDGGPNLGAGSVANQLLRFRQEFDKIRSAVVNEPRGSDAVVGALLLSPSNSRSNAGVIFFNNVGYLGMCVHGTIGVVTTLAHLNRIRPGECILETPVGVVRAILHHDGRVTVRNVPSHRTRKGIRVNVPKSYSITGDVAWGGNWFFLCSDHRQELQTSRIEALTDFAWRVRQALNSEGITGDDGHEIDHIELFGPPSDSTNDSRNFVLCPGKAYDRSPCGTGTSAKIACLAADNQLAEEEIWRQESIIGSVFEGSYVREGEQIIPLITGDAFITAEAKLLLSERDPFRFGIGAASETRS
jgi:4-hydroxyproline epimerase